MNQFSGFKKKILSTCIATVGVAAFTPYALAQVAAETKTDTTDDDSRVEEIVVKGVRASQAKAIDVKRNSAVVVDSIVAEDIGKLPDATITDSLQRVTGVQISRSAGEGTSLNVRGMPQVMSSLNGEQFLSPWNITEVGANYGDIPAGMINGVDVYKSQSAASLAGGISGLIDLKTMRPLKLKQGWTANLRVEASQGEYTHEEFKADGSKGSREPDQNISVFVGNNFDDIAAFTLGVFHATSYNANYNMSSNLALGFLNDTNGVPGDPYDINGNGDKTGDWYLVPTGFGVSSSYVDRQRDGAAFSFEAALGESFTFKTDVFYTKMDQHNRSVSANFAGNNTVDAFPENEKNGGNPLKNKDLYDLILPDSITEPLGSFTFNDKNTGESITRQLNTVRVAHFLGPEFISTSRSDIDLTEAINTNFQLDYTNSDNLEASIRYVRAEAVKNTRSVNLQEGAPAWDWIDNDDIPGKDPIANIYDVTVDYRGDYPKFIFPTDPELTSFDKLTHYQGGGDGYNNDATLDVFRADAKYTFNNVPYLESIEGGLRYGERNAHSESFIYVTPTARYEDWDQRVPAAKRGKLREGNEVWNRWARWSRFDYSLESQALRDNGLIDNGFRANAENKLLTQFRDFGPFKGFETGVSALNPAAWDEPLTFMNMLYPGTKTINDPARTYWVKEATSSVYTQLNFANEDFIVPFKGNAGVRVIETDREVIKTLVPEVLDKFNSVGAGTQRIALVADTETINKSFIDTLPSVNFNFFPHEEVVVRLGAAKTMTTNNLSNIGQSFTYWTTTCPKRDENGELILIKDGSGNPIGATVDCIAGGSDPGGIDLKPWRADVYNTSAEWYFDQNSILGVGLFMIDVKSAVQNGQEFRHFKDLDGIDRGNVVNVWYTKNVEASKLYGLEFGYKQPFTFLPGEFLSSTGIEMNYTYSNSQSTDRDLYGESLPLQSNSQDQANMILWYDRAGLNVRLAYNWRSEEYTSRSTANTNVATLDMGGWVEPSGYLDLSVSYWWNEHFSFFVNGSNLTSQDKRQYAQFTNQFSSLYVQERRVNMGISLSL